VSEILVPFLTMRQLCFFMLCSLAMANASAQNTRTELVIKFQQAEKQNHFAEAIELCRALQLTEPVNQFPEYWFSRMASLYKKAGDREEAKYWYRKAICFSPNDMSYLKRHWSQDLAKFYFEEEKWDSALIYLRFARNLFQIKKLCGSNSLDAQTASACFLMRAFKGAGQLDSAIHVFLPYAFQEDEAANYIGAYACHVATDDYHCQVSFFLNALEEKFGKDAARLELMHCFDRANISFATGPDLMFDIKGRFNFFGTSVNDLDFWFTTSADNQEAYRQRFYDSLHRRMLYLLLSPTPGKYY
jgi:tetratricopeptide (TPR) repeat protein